MVFKTDLFKFENPGGGTAVHKSMRTAAEAGSRTEETIEHSSQSFWISRIVAGAFRQLLSAVKRYGTMSSAATAAVLTYFEKKFYIF